MVFDKRHKSKEVRPRPKTVYPSHKGVEHKKSEAKHDIKQGIIDQIESKKRVTEEEKSNFEKNLWHMHLNGEITYNEFLDFKQKLVAKYKGDKKPKLDFEIKGTESESLSGADYTAEREEGRGEERWLREKRMEEEEALRIPWGERERKARFFSFLVRGKGFRLVAFVFLASFLIFFLTKTGLSVKEMSPVILILVVLFIIFLFGYSGNKIQKPNLFS